MIIEVKIIIIGNSSIQEIVYINNQGIKCLKYIEL